MMRMLDVSVLVLLSVASLVIGYSNDAPHSKRHDKERRNRAPPDHAAVSPSYTALDNE
jgi:hypothetical protein